MRNLTRQQCLPHNAEKTGKLLIITQFYPPDYAATGQLIEELALHLGQQGMAVRIFTGQPGYAFQQDFAPPIERSHNISIRRSRASRIGSRRIRGRAFNSLLFCLRAALHLLRNFRQRETLLVTSEPPYLPIIGYCANLLFGLPYVCLIYDIYPDIAVKLDVLSQEHWLVRFWHVVNRHVWHRAKSIIVLSPTMKQRITTEFPDLSAKISVIHSWANPEWIVPMPKIQNWFASQQGWLHKFVVLYSGNMGRCHDMETILAAAQNLLPDSTIQFVFIGDGAKRQFCVDTVKVLGLHNCQFLPYQDKQLLPYSLTACDVSLVSINPDMEGLIAPSKLYGILAAGRPVLAICEPHSYLRHVLAEAKCGAAFENGDGASLAQFIRYLAQNREVLATMGEAGRDYLKSNFTPEIIARQYSEVLRRDLQSNIQSELIVSRS